MTDKQENLTDIVAVKEADDLSSAKPAWLAWRATWLDQRAYHAVEVDPDPLQRGLVALLIALAITAVVRFIGIGLGVLTSPKLGVIQDQVYEAITGTAYYGDLAAQTPEFVEQFAGTYAAIWDIIRLLGGYPSFTGLGSSLLNLVIVLLSWLLFTTLSFLVARWLGSGAELKRALGVFALAYTPVMLTIIEAVPGAFVAWSLIFTLILVAKFLAAREVYELEPLGSLAAILLPYLIGIVIVLTLLILGAALGLNQIPYLDEFLRTLRFAGLVSG